jgi:hypothetical protein
VLYLYVGGKGGGSLTSTLNIGGWNGGGNGSGAGVGGGGGGATDIRRNRLVVTNKIIQSSTATLTTAETHGLSVGSSVIVSGVGTEFNGTFTLTAINATNKTLSYAVSTATLATSTSSGTVSGPSAWNTAASLATRVVVAGGAGGGGNNNFGGVGGGLIGGEGENHSCYQGYCAGFGGSQTYGNALGVGGATGQTNAGGGGGGYWGGWASGQAHLDRTGTLGYSGGGGGSSFTSADVTSVFHAQGVNSNAGRAVISWTSTPIITGVQATPLNASVAVSWNA